MHCLFEIKNLSIAFLCIIILSMFDFYMLQLFSREGKYNSLILHFYMKRLKVITVTSNSNKTYNYYFPLLSGPNNWVVKCPYKRITLNTARAGASLSQLSAHKTGICKCPERSSWNPRLLFLAQPPPPRSLQIKMLLEIYIS